MTDAMQSEKQAADWIAKLDNIQIEGIEGEDHSGNDVIAWFGAADPAFAAWIAQSVENRVAFLRFSATWRRADRLAALNADTAPAAGAAVSSFRQRPILAWAAAAALAFVAVFIAADRYFWAPGPEVFETAIGGHETVPLADGSRIELNTDTRLTAKIGSDRRAVALEKGEAYFDIARDETRPFIVEAGNKRITVLGTKFTVRRHNKSGGDGEVEVIVTEGRVRIDDIAVRAHRPPTYADKGTLVLARAGDTLVAEKTEEELSAELGWRQGLLIFDQMDLANVVDEFNRYNRVKLVVADPQAASIRIGGSFKAENVDAFARLLKDGFGLKVAREGNKIVIKA